MQDMSLTVATIGEKFLELLNADEAAVRAELEPWPFSIRCTEKFILQLDGWLQERYVLAAVLSADIARNLEKYPEQRDGTITRPYWGKGNGLIFAWTIEEELGYTTLKLKFEREVGAGWLNNLLWQYWYTRTAA